ncbi:hypothetical protein NEDG_01454 [Nematocida displodere]|uniref:Uncharacterized protein n=1 Tax=Nematocida displodere TaxID=1805483 RepID=A0A177EDA0_9MICR|nr:hypothetical protein NEDG_01454 [Nematocida displodere]
MRREDTGFVGLFKLYFLVMALLYLGKHRPGWENASTPRHQLSFGCLLGVISSVDGHIDKHCPLSPSGVGGLLWWSVNITRLFYHYCLNTTCFALLVAALQWEWFNLFYLIHHIYIFRYVFWLSFHFLATLYLLKALWRSIESFHKRFTGAIYASIFNCQVSSSLRWTIVAVDGVLFIIGALVFEDSILSIFYTRTGRGSWYLTSAVAFAFSALAFVLLACQCFLSCWFTLVVCPHERKELKLQILLATATAMCLHLIGVYCFSLFHHTHAPANYYLWPE